MATIGQFRTFIIASPFRPFVIRMAGGRVLTVRHPENAACDTRGRESALFDDDGMHLVEMLLVEVMEPAPLPTAPGPNGEEGQRQ
jgi:hypothetical protein